jgi:hypothetical protein
MVTQKRAIVVVAALAASSLSADAEINIAFNI